MSCIRCSTPPMPFGIFRKSPRPSLLLVLEAERAVVGGDDRQVVGAQPAPQVARVRLVLAAQRRRAHPLGALEVVPVRSPRAELVLERQVQVLRAGLGEHVRAARPRRADLGEGLGGGHVHDVERGAARDLGQRDGPVRRLRLKRGGPGQPVVERRGLASGDRLRRQHVDRDPVLRVHHDDRAVARGLLHGAQDLPVVAVVDARVGHEQLEAAHALVVDQRRPWP